MDKCISQILLKHNGLKITKHRIIILDEIIKIGVSFTAGNLFKKFSNIMDLVTIYRTLSLFEEKKIIRELLTREESKYYELSCMHNSVHPHFYCKKCKHLTCMDKLEYNDLVQLNENIADFFIEDISIEYTGLCSKCR